MADHSVRINVTSGRWKQLKAAEKVCGLPPAEQIELILKAFPGSFEDFAISYDMNRRREEIQKDPEIAKPTLLDHRGRVV